ncbi:MAG: carboxypeptidase regulatory-like domain-containing protein [Terriglobia bacterium]
MYRHCLVILAALLVAQLGFTQKTRTGAIRGTVIDQSGNAVAGATVWFHLLTNRPIFGAIPSARTTQDGHYAISNLPLGDYALNPWKEEDGYPNQVGALYSDGAPFAHLTRVSLTAEAPVVKGVVLVLGPKAGVIEGSISDAGTGKAVTAEVALTRTDKRGALDRSAKGSYRVLVPAAKGVMLSVRAPGYQDWYYPGVTDRSHTTPLVLHSDERRTINVRLVPKNQRQ